VLKSHKRAIAWKISDIKGIDPQFCTHKILMEENAKPVVQHQRRVNPKIHEVIKQEVIKLLDAGLIYPISDSPWVQDFPDCEDSRARSIHKSFTSSASFWESMRKRGTTNYPSDIPEIYSMGILLYDPNVDINKGTNRKSRKDKGKPRNN
ncbi:hypothetical protein Tco_0778592, partial [Tanacetum coccineum]